MKFFLIFLSGIALNLTPCVYPILPLTVSYFGGKARSIRGSLYIHVVFYILGISSVNSILALISAVTGNILGCFLQKEYITAGISTILIILSLSLFDLWEIRLPYKVNQIISRKFSGYTGSFIMGSLFGVFAAPCASPVILGLMSYALKEANLFYSFLYFFSLSLGIGLPVGVLATFSGLILRIPKPGEWMLLVKKILGLLMIFVALYLIRPVLGMAGDYILVAFSIFSAFYLVFFEKTGGKFSILNKALFIFFLFFSTSFLFHKTQRLPSYSKELFEKAKKEGKLIILDFSAEWCLSCIRLEKMLFDPEIRSLTKDVVLMKVDLTDEDESKRSLLERFKIKAVPTVVFLKNERFIKIEGEIEKELFIKKLKKALALD